MHDAAKAAGVKDIARVVRQAAGKAPVVPGSVGPIRHVLIVPACVPFELAVRESAVISKSAACALRSQIGTELARWPAIFTKQAVHT